MKKQVLLFVLMLMPLMASADKVEINGIYYNLNQETKQAEVTNSGSWGGGGYSGDIIIPQTVEHVGISYSVTSIGNESFWNCSVLTSISIPNSVTTIGIQAFDGCSGLINVTIPECVTTIGRNAFCGCSGLTSVTIPNSVTSIGNNAFADCSGLTSVTIGNGVTNIGGNAFGSCSTLTSVHISDLSAWCKIIFEKSPIAYSLSYNCSSNPLYYANHLYLNGKEVMDLIVPDEITSINDCAFINCSLTSVIIPNSVTTIGNYAFSGCTGFTSLTIPNSVTSIGNYAFQFCTGLTSVTIGSSVTSIGSNAFYGCSGLTSVTIPNSVTSIGESTFAYGSGITSIIIGKGIETIGSRAFASCESLEDVYCHAEKVPSAETNAFDGSYISYATLHVPENSINQYRRREPWSGFETIKGIIDEEEFDDGNKCAKPVITILANGKIKVESATEGATCVTNITASNAEPLTDEEISLTPLIVYTVTSYATKEGYDDSEVTTATFRYEKTEGDMNGDGMLNITDVIHLVNMILSK